MFLDLTTTLKLIWAPTRPLLSSSNPNFSKSRSSTANSDFGSRLTHQLLERSKSTWHYNS
jgi:hypothetical protein